MCVCVWSGRCAVKGSLHPNEKKQVGDTFQAAPCRSEEKVEEDDEGEEDKWS